MNISILNEMSCLKILYLPDNNLTDITVLGNLKSLKKLVFKSNNSISDIAPVADIGQSSGIASGQQQTGRYQCLEDSFTVTNIAPMFQ